RIDAVLHKRKQLFVHIEFCSKGMHFVLQFCPGVNIGAMVAVNRFSVGTVLNKVLVYFGTDQFQQVAHVPQQRKIAQNGMLFLKNIVNSENEQDQSYARESPSRPNDG